MRCHSFAVGVAAGLSIAATAWSAFPQEAGQPGERQVRPAAVRLSLEDALAAAESRAPSVEAAARQAEAADLRETVASRSRFGQLDSVFGYWRYQDDQIVRPMSRQLFGPRGFVGLPFDRDQLHYGLVFQAPLYAGGRLDAARDLAATQSAHAALLVQGTRWEVRANVAATYAAVAAIDAASGAADATLEALKATRRRLDAAVHEGKRPRLDLLKVDEELADATARRALLQAESARGRALLLAAIGRDPAQDVELDDLSDAEPRVTVEERELKALVVGASVVRRSRLQVDQSGAATRIARAALRPSVTVRGNLTGNSALGIGEHLGVWDMSVNVTMPLFNNGAKRAEVAAARAQERAAAMAAEKTTLEREALLVEVQARLRASAEARRAAQARSATADEAARIERVRYEAGSGTVEDLLRATARQEAARAALAQAKGEVVATAARLNAICEREVVR